MHVEMGMTEKKHAAFKKSTKLLAWGEVRRRFILGTENVAGKTW
jgi:hypothetical protein